MSVYFFLTVVVSIARRPEQRLHECQGLNHIEKACGEGIEACHSI